jgi:putative endonuclease
VKKNCFGPSDGGEKRKLRTSQQFKMKHGGCTYMLTNKNNRVIYVGVTSALRARIWQHKTKFYPKSFSAKYNCGKIVWYECFPSIVEAIDREKQLKGGNRKQKEDLINAMNPQWKDLWDDIQDL